MLILIYGITGWVGRACARAALDAGHSVRGLGRSPEKLPADIATRLESFVKIADMYDLAGLASAVGGGAEAKAGTDAGEPAASVAVVDAVISAVAANAALVLEGQLLLLRAAERAGVRIFHAASWNFDWTGLELGEIDIYDAYIAFRNHVQLTCPTLRPLYAFTGVIVEEMFFNAPSGGNPIDKLAGTLTYAGTGDETVVYTTLADLARYTLHAIEGPTAADGGVYHVESFRCSHRQLAETYGRVRGSELRMKCVAGADGIADMLYHARCTLPRHRFMEYNGLAFGEKLLNGSLLYDALDSRRWAHIKQMGLEEWLKLNPDA